MPENLHFCIFFLTEIFSFQKSEGQCSLPPPNDFPTCDFLCQCLSVSLSVLFSVSLPLLYLNLRLSHSLRLQTTCGELHRLQVGHILCYYYYWDCGCSRNIREIRGLAPDAFT